MGFEFILLALIVAVAYMVGATTGFGSSIIALTVAAHIFPLDFLIPVIIPINLAATTYIAWRHFSDIDWQIFLKRIVPLTLIGQPVGMAVFYMVNVDGLKWTYGVFVLCLSIFELSQALKMDANLPVRPMKSRWSFAWLISGGFIQGLWVSGGPLIGYWAARNIHDKHIFRSTLTALWLLLNSILLVTHLISGKINAETGRVSAWMLIPLAVGLFMGERLHDRLPQRSFKLLVYAVLVFAGASIIIRGL